MAIKDRTKSQVSRQSRRKGHEFMNWVAKALQSYWPKAERREQYRGGKRSCDVEQTPLWIECKRVARPPSENAITNFLLRATEERNIWERTDNRRPVVLIVRADRIPVRIYHEPGTLEKHPSVIKAGTLIKEYEKKEKEKRSGKKDS